MKQLGIGVRVYVNWSDKVHPSCVVGPCSVAKITGGPNPPEIYESYLFPGIYWELDNNTVAEQHLLTPLDDGPEALTTELETANLLED